jgi:CBS-domain-containing membrane protein
VAAFLEAGSHRLVVTDEQGRAIGLISDADVVARVQAAQRRGVLQALRLGGGAPPSAVTAAELMSPGVLAVSPETSIVEATRRMLAARRKWMVVVDEHERPIGLIDRQILLRALSSR